MDNTLHELYGTVMLLSPEIQGILLPVIDRLMLANKQRKETLSVILTTLQSLRVEIKSLIFDLECTRKERDGK
jgi:hypothetical protein